MGPPGLFHFIIFLHLPAVLPLSGLILQTGFTNSFRGHSLNCAQGSLLDTVKNIIKFQVQILRNETNSTNHVKMSHHNYMFNPYFLPSKKKQFSWQK